MVTKWGIMVPGIPCDDCGDSWGWDCNTWLLTFRDGVRCLNLQRKFWQESCLIHLSCIQRFFARLGTLIMLLQSQPGKQSSQSKHFYEITTELISVWVQTTKTLTKNSSQWLHVATTLIISNTAVKKLYCNKISFTWKRFWTRNL